LTAATQGEPCVMESLQESPTGSAVGRQVTSRTGRIHRSTIRTRGDGAGDAWDKWWSSFLRGATPQLSDARPRAVRALDLFASAGGLTLGVREAARALNLRLQVSLAADLDADALATYALNFRPDCLVNKSVRSLVEFQVLGQGGAAQMAFDPIAVDEANEFPAVDLVMGGPPCQGHSSLNNHTRGDDQRNDLYLTLPALAIAVGAKAVLIENVPRVVHDRRQVVASAVQLLRSSGYWVSSGVLSAHEMGWPQTRSRHFLVASRVAELGDLSTIAQSFGRHPRGIFWAIGDLAGQLNEASLFDSVPKLSATNQDRLDWLFDNDAYELPNHIRPDCHKDGHTYPAVYGRLFPGSPAPTLTTGFQTPGRGRYIHPSERRVLTVREAARIQGFPDSFQFTTAVGELRRSHLHKWIGDAVPSFLGYVAALVALEPLARP
jgi:DNA (cytosine-5)-methyltransferase 1